MRRRVISVVIVALVGLAVFVAVLAAQRLSFSEQPIDLGRNRLPVKEAGEYTPEADFKGIRVSMQLDATDLRSQSFEVDIVLNQGLGKLFEIADAAIAPGEKFERLDPQQQPFLNQTPPEGVQARFLVPPLKPAKYSLSIYLAPRDEKTVPSAGLEFLSSPESLNRNVQATLVNQ